MTRVLIGSMNCKILAMLATYLLYQAFSSDNFLLNQTSSFINILQIIDRKLIFDTVFVANNLHKSIKSSFGKYCRVVSIIVDKWKTICM